MVFPGKTLARAPAEINIRAQSNPLFVAPEFTLKLRPVPGGVLDLTSFRTSYLYGAICAPGEPCAVIGIVSTLPLGLAKQILEADHITGEILGLKMSLQKADMDAIRAFVMRVAPEAH